MDFIDSISLVDSVPQWFTNWITAIWLVGIGVAAGIALLFVIWLLGWGLSRVPGLGNLQENRSSFHLAAIILAVIFFSALAGLQFAEINSAETVDSESSFRSLVGLLLPLAIFCWLSALAVLVIVQKRTVEEVPNAVREGVLWPIFNIAIAMAVLGIISTLFVREPSAIFSSLERLTATGKTTFGPFEIPANESENSFAVLDQYEMPVPMKRSELVGLTIRSDQRVVIAPKQGNDLLTVQFDVAANEEYPWVKGLMWTKGVVVRNVFDTEDIEHLYVRNYGSDIAHVEIDVTTRPQFPEAMTIPIVAISLVILFLVYIVHRALMPKVSAVALATVKSEVNQPLFIAMMLIGITALIVFIFVPYHTFGEDIKVLKDTGMTLVMIFGIILAVWSASTSVAEEIEGRTALTVLSKPLTRRSFVIGKFLGISWTVALLFLVFGLVLVFVVAYKPIYDAKEEIKDEMIYASWQVCHSEMISTMPGLALAFMETVILAALSVAISTRVPILGNFLICFTIYVLGHLSPLIVQSSIGQFEIVAFVGQFIATVFPNLEHFNIQAAIAGGQEVPYDYLGWALVYCFIYSVIAMLLALISFEDRDVA